MTDQHSLPSKLYLLQLSVTTLPLPSGRTLEMVSAAYLIEMQDGLRILIDTGLPRDYSVPPNVPPSREKKNVLEHLDALRFRPADIDLLIATHFDIDHVGYHDAFSSAQLIVQGEHYDLARAGHPRFAAGRPHWDHPALRYRLLDGDTQLLPGITLLETSGHCPGHQSVLVHLPRTGPVLLAIDAVMMQSQFTMERKPWPTDDNAAQALASTKKLLDVVDRERVSLIVFGHDGLQWQSLKKAPGYYE